MSRKLYSGAPGRTGSSAVSCMNVGEATFSLRSLVLFDSLHSICFKAISAIFLGTIERQVRLIQKSLDVCVRVSSSASDAHARIRKH